MTHMTSRLHETSTMVSRRLWQRLSRKAQRNLYIGALVVSDILMVLLGFLLAYLIRFRTGLPIFEREALSSLQYYTTVTYLLATLWILLFVLFRLYEWENLLGGIQEYALVANASTVAVVLVVAAGFISSGFIVSRGWLLLAWVLTFLCAAVARFCLRHLVYRLRHRGCLVAPAVIVGTNEEAKALAEQLAGWRASGLSVVGYIENGVSASDRNYTNPPVLGDLDALPEVIEHNQVEEVIVATSAVSKEQLLEVFRRYGGSTSVNVRLSSGLFDIINTGLKVKSLGYVPLISVEKARLSRLEAFMKRCLDCVGAAVGLLVLSPLYACLALAVRFSSPGPVIYRRKVLGQGGKVFDAFKFRTMYVNGDELLTAEQWAYWQQSQKLKEDPRVTRVGRFLRKYSLDELPQLVNVLRGQMSLIGPRIITPEEKEKYGKWDMNLLTVKPGLSGLWQVNGRSDVSYEERVRLDMQYIRNYTIWLDLQLLLQTVLVVVRGKGAY